MKLLYIIDSLVPGGAEQALVAMAPGLVAHGIDLDVAYLWDRPGLQGRLKNSGASLVSLAGPGGRAGWMRRASSLARASQPDLIHTTLYEANQVGRLAGLVAGVPVVSSLVNVTHGSDQRSAPGLRTWRTRGAHLLDVVTARKVVRFHAITAWVADVMAERLRIARERIDVVPRGRDPHLLGQRSEERREAARRMLGIAPRNILILAAARQEYQKGLDQLLEAVALLRAELTEVRLVIAGRTGNHTPQLQAAVARLRLTDVTRFLGVRDDVPDLLCAADVFVVPSRWEGLGSVLLEAMALGAPIVASAIPPIEEIVSNDLHARLVPPCRPSALAGAIADAVKDDRGSAARVARARHRFFERFTIDRVTAEMVTFYARAIGSKKGEIAA